MDLRTMARRLGVKSRDLRAEAEAGRVPFIRVGDDYLFDAARVEAALLARADAGDHRKAAR